MKVESFVSDIYRIHHLGFGLDYTQVLKFIHLRRLIARIIVALMDCANKNTHNWHNMITALLPRSCISDFCSYSIRQVIIK